VRNDAMVTNCGFPFPRLRICVQGQVLERGMEEEAPGKAPFLPAGCKVYGVMIAPNLNPRVEYEARNKGSYRAILEFLARESNFSVRVTVELCKIVRRTPLGLCQLTTCGVSRRGSTTFCTFVDWCGTIVFGENINRTKCEYEFSIKKQRK